MDGNNVVIEALSLKINNNLLRMCSREDALRAVVFDHMGYGKIESLQEKIGEAMFNDFCNLGYVQEIMPSKMDGSPVLWKRTKIADEDYKFYDPDFKREIRLQLEQTLKQFELKKSLSRARYAQFTKNMSPAIKARLMAIRMLDTSKQKSEEWLQANNRDRRGLKEKNDVAYFFKPDDI